MEIKNLIKTFVNFEKLLIYIYIYICIKSVGNRYIVDRYFKNRI